MRSSTSANGGWPRSDLRFAQAVIRFLAQRIALGALVVVFASALTFFFVNLAPGGPASVMRFDVSAEQREALIHRMGLDRPVPERYVEWLAAAVRGDLGSSLLTDEPVAPRTVITRHALRNALIPVVSAIGALVPRLLGGTVVTEAVFGWPGMGRLALEAAQGRDYPLVTGLTVVVAAIAVAASLAVDLAYTRIDPRIRLT